MKILITGGTGLIGRAFMSHYGDYHYTLLSRTTGALKKAIITNNPVVMISSLEQLDNLDDFDAVINLAGEPIIDKRWSVKQKKVICDSRWELTQKLVSLFEASKDAPSVFVNGSAIGVYGDRGDEVLHEDVPVKVHDFSSQLCLGWEDIAHKASPFTRVVLLRTGIFLASNGGALAKMVLPFKLCLGGRISHGQHYMSWVHGLDHIRAMHFVLNQKSIQGPVNLVAPNPQKNTDFTQDLAKALNRIAIFPMPKKALQIILGESSCLLLDSQRVVPKKLTDNGFEFKFPNLAQAFADLFGTNR